MSKTFYQPLTPDLRKQINETIDNNISELNTCKTNGYVACQINSYKALKYMIKALPDGYPVPMTRD